jgi:hypothetical protein
VFELESKVEPAQQIGEQTGELFFFSKPALHYRPDLRSQYDRMCRDERGEMRRTRESTNLTSVVDQAFVLTAGRGDGEA